MVSSAPCLENGIIMTNCLTSQKCIEQEIVTTHKIISSGSIVSVTLTKKQNADCTIDFVSLLDASGNSYPSDSEFISVGEDVVRVVIEGGGGGGGGSSIDYTALITAIKNSVQSIDGDTDALAGILLAVDTLESIGTTGNATASQILTAVSSILTQAQATNANTDQLEALLTSLETTLKTESDQTQVGLLDIKSAVDNIPVVLELVDYVAPINVSVNSRSFNIDGLGYDTKLSGTGQLWDDAFPHPPANVFNALDGATSWKVYGNFSSQLGAKYVLRSSLDAAQGTIKVFLGSDVRQVQAAEQEFSFVGDGSFVQVGYIFEPNTQAGQINDFYVDRIDLVQGNAGSCKEFVRIVKNGVTSDYKADGLTPYTVTGVVQRKCPVTFLSGTDSSVQTFSGYKSLSITVTDGQVIIGDTLGNHYLPKSGANGTAIGIEFDGASFANSNTITVTPADSATYIWTGVK